MMAPRRTQKRPVRSRTFLFAAWFLLVLSLFPVPAGAYEMTVLVVYAYRIVEDGYTIHVSFDADTSTSTVVHEEHDVFRVWDAAADQPEVVVSTVAERTEIYVDLSPFDPGVHAMPPVVLEDHPASSVTLDVGSAGTIPPELLLTANPDDPGLSTADEMDDDLQEYTAALLSESIRELREAREELNEYVQSAVAHTDEETLVANEEAAGDPVLVGSGQLVITETDLDLNAGAVPFVIRRTHRTNLGLGGSLGNEWWFSFDSRLIFGETQLADEAADVAEANARALEEDDLPALHAVYLSARDLITALMEPAQDGLARAVETRDALVYAAVTFHGDHRAKVVDEVNAQLDLVRSVISGYESLLATYTGHLTALEEAYGAGDSGVVSAIQGEIANQQAAANLLALQAARSASHAERNDRFVPGRPAAMAREPRVERQARAAGNNSVTLVDTDGIVRRFTHDETPLLGTPFTYAGGLPNYYPSGTALTVEEPAPLELRLMPGGEYHLLRRDRTTWVYGTCGQLLRIEDRNGNAVHLHYGTGEQLESITDSRGRVVTLTRDSDTNVTLVQGPCGVRIVYEYEGGRLAAVTDPVGDAVRFEYTGTLLSRVIKPDGSHCSYDYAMVRGRVRAVSTTDECGATETFDFSLAGETVHTNPSGVVTAYHLTEDRRIARIDRPSVSGPVSSEYFTYDEWGNVVSHRTPDGNEYRFAWDNHHNLLRRDFPDGTRETWSYTTDNQPASHRDRSGAIVVWSYDDRGNVTEVRYMDGTRDTFTVVSPGSPAAGEVASHTDRRGNTIRFTYDGHGFPASVTDNLGPMEDFCYDELGRLVERHDALGNVTRYTWSADGFITRVGGPEGQSVVAVRDERKDVTAITVNGKPTTVVWDDCHRPLRITNALGQVASFAYRGDGLLLNRSVANLDGTEMRQWSYEYDDRGNLVRETPPGVGEPLLYEYDWAGRVTAHTDAEGNRAEYCYSPDGNVVSWTRFLDGRAVSEQYGYGPAGRMNARTDSLGHTTTWTHDASRRLVVQTDPLGNRSETTLDPYGLVMSLTDATGRAVCYAYDARGRLTTVMVGSRTSAEYGYDLAGNLISFSDGEGGTWRYTYDGAGRPVMVTHPDGAARTISYNVDGSVSAWTDEAGRTTSFTFDALGRITSRVDPGRERATTYSWGLTAIRSVSDPTGRTTGFNYDDAGHLVGILDAGGSLTTIHRDGNGLLTGVADATGRITTYEHDSLYRLISASMGANAHLSFAYDSVGNLTSRTDGTGGTRVFSYDDANGLIAESSASGLRTSYTRDGAGRIVNRTGADGATTRYGYDHAGNLTTVDFHDGSFLEFDYDGAGRLVAARNESGLLNMAYTARGQLESVSDGISTQRYQYDETSRRVRAEDSATGAWTAWQYDDRGFVAAVHDRGVGDIGLEHDDAGRLTAVQPAAGPVTRRSYDGQGLLASVTVSACDSGPVLHGLAFVRDAAGRRIYEVEAGGAVTAYDYDDSGRLVRARYPFDGSKRTTDYLLFAAHGVVPPIPICTTSEANAAPGEEHAQPGGTPFSSILDLSSEENELIAEARRLIHPLQKASVPSGIPVWTEEFDYDAGGNRLAWRTGWGEVGYTYDAEGWLERAGATTYDHDVNGNLSRSSTAGATFEFTFNALNRMVSASTPAASVEYEYDALGRRVGRLEAASVTDSPELSKSISDSMRLATYRYDGLSFVPFARSEISRSGIVDPTDMFKDPLLDDGRYRSDSPATISRLVETLLGPGEASAEVYLDTVASGMPLAVSGPNGTRWLSHDERGSVIAATGQAGLDMTAYRYDAFGNPTDGAWSPAQPYGFAAAPFDAATGLHDLGMRDYQPVTGRFTTADPIRDSLNWYTYAANDPINLSDVLGLAPRTLTQSQRESYKVFVSSFGGPESPIPTYADGPRAGQHWDCADLATYIANGAVESSTGIQDFHTTMTVAGQPLETIPGIHSSDFATDGNVTFYRTADGFIDNAFDSPNVETGTIGVFNNHIITVTNDRLLPTDPIETIQGHAAGDVDRLPISTARDLDAYVGEFIGWAEANTDPVVSSRHFLTFRAMPGVKFR